MAHPHQHTPRTPSQFPHPNGETTDHMEISQTHIVDTDFHQMEVFYKFPTQFNICYFSMYRLLFVLLRLQIVLKIPQVFMVYVLSLIVLMLLPQITM